MIDTVRGNIDAAHVAFGGARGLSGVDKEVDEYTFERSGSECCFQTALDLLLEMQHWTAHKRHAILREHSGPRREILEGYGLDFLLENAGYNAVSLLHATKHDRRHRGPGGIAPHEIRR